MNARDHTVVFTPAGRAGSVPEGTSVLAAAREFGVDLDSVCGGRGICGRCLVNPSFGSFAKWAIDSDASSLSPWTTTEAEYRGKRAIAEGQRLGCTALIQGDCVIDVPPASQIHRQVIRKDLNVVDLAIDPIYTLHYVELESDEPLEAALGRQWAIQIASDWKGEVPSAAVTVALRRERGRAPEGGELQSENSFDDGGTATIAAVFEGYVDSAFGVAIDIGSTTVAAHLVDLASGEVAGSAGQMNPQIRFGEDLMSRVSYVMMNPGGDRDLTVAVRRALDDLMEELVASAEIEVEQVLDIVMVGNPVMHHLVLGLDPTPLGQAPFPLAIEGSFHTTAAELELGLPNSSVYVAPCIAGHVGADTAAAILAEGPHRNDRVQLLVDVGTNAEIVLGNNQQLFAASSPTGPAFEGAQISSGQRATAGAIERVEIDRETLEPRFKVIGCEVWSDDPGFESANTAGVTGICGSGIIEVLSELVSSGVIDAQGVIRPQAAEKTDRVVADERTFSYVLFDDIHVTQADVRAIQLAKAALRAGIDLLMEHADLVEVDEIRLAGAFGAHIDPAHAINLGLIPPCDLAAVHAVGNSAGVGAVRGLLSQSQRREMEATVALVTKIETATEPRFQEHFVTALSFANAVASEVEPRGRRRRNRDRKRNGS